MSKLKFFLPLLVSPLFAAPLSPEQAEEAKIHMLEMAAQQQQQQKKEKPPSDEMMVVTPEARSSDLKQAFELLSRGRGSHNIVVTLNDGQMLKNILDLNVMNKGTLIVFELNTVRGLQYKVVKTDNVKTITATK